MLLATGWRHHGEVREHESGHPMEPGTYMRDASSTEDAKAAGMSPLRLRVGVFLSAVDRAVLGVGALHRGFPQWAQ